MSSAQSKSQALDAYAKSLFKYATDMVNKMISDKKTTVAQLTSQIEVPETVTNKFMGCTVKDVKTPKEQIQECASRRCTQSTAFGDVLNETLSEVWHHQSYILGGDHDNNDYDNDNIHLYHLSILYQSYILDDIFDDNDNNNDNIHDYHHIHTVI